MQRLEQRVLAQPIAAVAHERLEVRRQTVRAIRDEVVEQAAQQAYFARAASGQSINVPSCRACRSCATATRAVPSTRVGSANSGLRNSRLEGE